jgi:DNA-binding NarL/FixJ family response regulator
MKILICDDQDIVRDGLKLLLKLERDIEIMGVARDGAEAVELTLKAHPDLVLMDLKMPIMNGVEATREIKNRLPEVKVLVLTTYATDEWVLDAVRAGASGYLLKDASREELLKAIRGTVAGKTFLDPSIAGKLTGEVSNPNSRISNYIQSKLTSKEIEVLRLIIRGMTNEEIASEMFLSEGTVRNYISSIINKLEVADKTQAVLMAIQHGLIEKAH